MDIRTSTLERSRCGCSKLASVLRSLTNESADKKKQPARAVHGKAKSTSILLPRTDEKQLLNFFVRLSQRYGSEIHRISLRGAAMIPYVKVQLLPGLTPHEDTLLRRWRIRVAFANAYSFLI